MSIVQVIMASMGAGGPVVTYPEQGSGSYEGNIANLNGSYVNAGQQGVTPITPGSEVDSVPNYSPGWNRRITNVASLYGLNLFNENPITSQTVDAYGGFGIQNIPAQYYAIEWRGYWQCNQTGVWNVGLYSDDLSYFWIGTNALNGNYNFSNYHISVNCSAELNSTSMDCVNGKWYPIRMWFIEYTGAEACQVFMAPVGSTPLSMNNYNIGWNTATAGI